jgi:hypothetical protein
MDRGGNTGRGVAGVFMMDDEILDGLNGEEN